MNTLARLVERHSACTLHEAARRAPRRAELGKFSRGVKWSAQLTGVPDGCSTGGGLIGGMTAPFSAEGLGHRFAVASVRVRAAFGDRYRVVLSARRPRRVVRGLGRSIPMYLSHRKTCKLREKKALRLRGSGESGTGSAAPSEGRFYSPSTQSASVGSSYSPLVPACVCRCRREQRAHRTQAHDGDKGAFRGR